MSVRPSVCPYPPSKTSSNRPIFKILFLLERYDIRYLSFVLFVLSVRPSVPPFSKTSSNRPIFKILFLLERYLTRYLYLINCFRLSVRFSVRLSLDSLFRLPTISTVRFKKLTLDTYLSYQCPSVHTIRVSLSIKFTGK